ncbi:MAG: DUF4159 domain-containing protein [Acidobacteria bacterium]|nr:DUF4159 domain-containing protein [Acidobacteriota bacterium]
MIRRSVVCVVLAAMAATALASGAFAQWGYGRSRHPPRFRPADHVDEGFSFCRLMYTSNRRERSGRGWSTDYPFADINFMIRLSEMTSTHVNLNRVGDPNHWVVTVTDDSLYGCPFLMTSDVGTMSLRPVEAKRLRDYLLKGGFLWVDDFWGSRSWNQWAGEIAKVLPPSEYPIKDLPLDHQVFKTMFNIQAIPQISNIHFWRWSGGTTTSERGQDSAVPHFRGIMDEQGRLMVAMTHNTDIQDAWEREGEDPRFFERFSPDGYQLGVNVVLYAMSH